MKTVLRFLFCLPVLLNLASAQLPVIDWYNCFGGNRGESANSVYPTSDGGFIFAGITDSWNNGDVSGSHGLNDLWVVKTNSKGVLEWQRNLGSMYLEDAGTVKETSDGGYIIAGMASLAEGDVSGSHGNLDYWVVKLSRSGTIEWQRCYGGLQADYGKSLDFTTDGGYILAGYTESSDMDVSSNHGLSDFWIVRINQTGDILWQKSLGGSGWDEANSIYSTSDGGYVVAGSTTSSDKDVTGNAANANGNQNYWVVKLNASGSIEWQRAYGGSRNDIARSVKQTIDGGYIVAGISSSTDGDVTDSHGGLSDGWVLKLSSAGNIEWKKSMGSSDEDGVCDVVTCEDGGFVFTGYARVADGDVACRFGDKDVWTFKLSTAGDMVWQRSFEGLYDDFGQAISKVAEDEFIICANTLSEELRNFHQRIDNYPPPDALLIHLTVVDLSKVQLSIAGSESVCKGSPADYSASVNYNFPNATYDWLINDNIVGSGETLHIDNITGETTLVGRLYFPATCLNKAYTWHDTIYIKPAAFITPTINVTANKTTICKGDPVMFNVAVNGNTPVSDVLWQLNKQTIQQGDKKYTTASLNDGDEISCRVIFKDAKCGVPEITSSPVEMHVNDIPAINIYPSDTLVQPGSKIRLSAIVPSGVAVSWEPVNKLVEANGPYATTIPVSEDAVFIAKATGDGGCFATDTATVKTSRMLTAIPNAFTPNGDGINDEFFVPAAASFSLHELMIFDRWGNKIFSSKSSLAKWNGTFNGKPLPAGGYVFVVTGSENGKPVNFKGVVHVVR